MIVPSTRRCEGCFAIASPPLAQLPVQHGRAASGAPVNGAEVYGALPAYRRGHLRYEPTRVSKSRIKRLRGLSQPQYRLRVGEVRVFYDVTSEAVEVLAIVTKAKASRWLAEHGTPDAPSGAG